MLGLDPAPASGDGGYAASNQAFLDFLKLMNDQQQAQIAAEKASQAEALRQSTISSEQQAADQATQLAKQQLQTSNQMQQVKDQQALQNYQAKMKAAGSAATGGPIDVNAIRMAALGNLGSAYGTLPKTMYNTNPQVAAIGVNPALTSAGSAGTAASQFNPINQYGSQNQQVKFGGLGA